MLCWKIFLFGVENITRAIILGFRSMSFFDFFCFFFFYIYFCISFILLFDWVLVFSGCVWEFDYVFGFRREEHKRRWRGKFWLIHMEVRSRWRWTLISKFFHGKLFFLTLFRYLGFLKPFLRLVMLCESIDCLHFLLPIILLEAC